MKTSCHDQAAAGLRLSGSASSACDNTAIAGVIPEECITDLGVLCCRAFGNPSYHVQALFAVHQGEVLARTSVDSRSPRDNGVAASATCQDAACATLSIKVSSPAVLFSHSSHMPGSGLFLSDVGQHLQGWKMLGVQLCLAG